MANGVIGVVSLLVLRAVGQARNIEQGNVIILLHLVEEKIAPDYPSIWPIVILSLVKLSITACQIHAKMKDTVSMIILVSLANVNQDGLDGSVIFRSLM